MRVELGRLEWPCHVCGATRPDAEIGVVSRRRDLIPGVPMQENLRFCRVTDSCVRAAEAWRTFEGAETFSDGLARRG